MNFFRSFFCAKSKTCSKRQIREVLGQPKKFSEIFAIFHEKYLFFGFACFNVASFIAWLCMLECVITMVTYCMSLICPLRWSIKNSSVAGGGACPYLVQNSGAFWLRSSPKVGEDLFFLFWTLPVFGRKNRLNFWFRPENPSQFQCRPFF